MAMDGSFSLESAMEGFLTRCPKLSTIDKLQRLVETGHTVTEEEVVRLLAELFLNPNYTISLIGSFRPVARMIVDQAVALLRNCNLSSGSDDIGGDFVDADVLYVIEHYERSGRGLKLHELACLAFCRALDLDHSLLGSVTTYFKFAPPPFERILRKSVVSEAQLFQAANHYLLAVRISYRLLLMQPEFFSEQWNWSCFLDLVKKSVNLDLVLVTKDAEVVADIKWCGIQILCTILGMSDKAVENFGVGAEEAALCLLRWEEFCQDVAIEKFCLYVGSSEQTNFGSFTGGIKFSQQNLLKSSGLNSLISSHCHQIEPVIKSRRVVTWDDRSTAYPFVVTSMMSKSFEMVLLAVSQKWPVLLYGPPGAGKTALINKLAHDAGNQVLSIHMDDQIDGKTLIGSYVCTEQPGEFRWQPGSLIQAVLNGYWVVFEDIDKAPSDVQSILLPLLEGEISFITNHGEEIRVAESFQLFSTITTSKSNVSHTAEGGSSLSTLWRKVMIGLPSNDDLENIMNAWYPSLGPLTGRLIETMERVNPSPSGNTSCLSCLNRFSLRDLLKWCKRISELGLDGDTLTAYQCRLIYQEAVDIFVSFSVSSENRLTIMRDIAKLWGVPISETGILYPYKPEIQNLFTELRIGRVTLQRTEPVVRGQERLVEMRSSLYVLEQIACAVKYNESILLVGETGTGKTTLVQNLAMMLGQKLTVLNLSQQSDVADLLGGFKPIDSLSICIPLYKEFEVLFSKTFSMKENDKIFAFLQKQMKSKNWKTLLNGFKKYVGSFQKKLQTERSGSGKKRKKPLDENIRAWESFSVKLETALRQIEASSGMVFSFVEGSFITALRNGEWILLDEVNLAPPETLQRVIGVLEGEYGSLCLAERGDVSHIPRHPSFRIFACMNPATDAGKRDLPYSLQSRFTAYFVHDVLDRDDLKLFINKFMEESISNIELEKKIIDFYEAAKKKSEERLQDGANQKPQYSLRSLYRALEYTREAKGKFGFPKAIYDGFCMFFLTMLDRPSAKIMKKMIKEKLLGGNKPKPVPFDAYLRITKISGFDDLYENYVLTKSVKKQLENLARAVFIKRYPVLLQGPTSSGKTSLVQYLAARTGHEFVRINNHEHTDLQEYLGSYISDAQGKLVFQEGILVKAVRNGHWIVLDELNLAPSDVLEALNRLLDDNRELFVPELRETVRAHPNFMLFATQNPPTFYGGRKMLSRAFRNRFVEVHVDEIPDDELSTIIEKRCKIPGSRAKLMVEVMKELQLHRQSSKVFAGKHGFITPRDLFRWANRLRAFGDSKEVMAEHGYYLLADRLRDDRERHVVQEVLERRLRVKIARDDLYKESIASVSESIGSDMQNLGDVILTRSMRRLYFLVKRCFELREPVLLVGETGGGKTTVCQLLSRALGLKLHILNCHQYTETSDFIGGFFPVRERSRLASEFKYIIEKWMLSKAYTHFPQDLDLSSDIVKASSTLDHLNLIITSYRQGHVSCPNVSVKDIDSLEQMKLDLTCLHQKWQTIFMWQDGPLVQAMKSGDLFLVDEISLADDSVLERLNSVLEPERKLSLAEKGGPVMDNITAHEFFFVLATMNPGGDYGKKELSPALRNRFTEIWVPPVCDLDELGDIASKRLSNPELTYIVDAMLKFWEWFNKLEKGRILTVRDLLSWIQFIMVTTEGLGPDCAFLHGLFLVLLDGISLGTGISSEDAGLFRETCLSFLLKELKEDSNLHELSFIENYGWGDLGETGNISCSDDMQCDNSFGIDPFYIEKGYEKCEAGGFEFLTPTTRRNALRVLRAMQLPKPVLLEGSPGVGKTSLIMALGNYSGHKVVRINLSEQTDLMDLLGTDLPVESDEGMKFAWSDGILLQALKEGCWVLLDELNLAPQSVLEGLNAILDHRAEVFIPELSLTFKCPSSFRIFACQNPFSQGGGRKGLPKSFLNRFTKVYIDELVEGDYLSICNSIYPSIPRPLLSKLIVFNKRLHEDTMFYHKFGQDGSPWEFNLRDVIRSCQIIEGVPEKLKADCFLNILYVQRMRTAADRKEVLRIYEEVFGVKPFINPYPRVQLNSKYLVVGNTVIKRNTSRSSKLSNSALNVIPSIRHNLEAVAHCIKHQWLCILVGPPCSGKTSLIRLLAHLTGNVLNELSLSTTTDISELLGCFEQYNAFRNFRSVIAQVERYVSEYCNLQLEFSKVAFMKERSDLITKWLAFLSTMNSSSMTSSSSIHVENWESMTNSLSLLVEIIQQMKMDVVANELLFSWSTEELNKTIKVISKLQDDQQRRSRSVKFEWVAGLLIKAIENGEWIILENANLCNPTVLDRINSLVEPSGSITVNECGIVDGSSVVLHPHHNFRIFLTVNPSHGEVSRAMRNRGVEIFMMPPYWLYNDESGCSGADFELKDVKRFLVSSGILMNRLVDSMSKAHVYAKNEGLHVNVQISYLELAHWVQLFHQLLINGNQPFWSLQLSWEHTYLSSLGEAVGWDIVNHAKAAYFSTITLSESDLPTELSFNMPVGLPVPKKLRDFIWYSKETSVRQNLMYLEYLVAQYELGFSRNMSCVDNALSATSHMGGTGWMDMKMMGQLMFPKALNCMNANSVRNTEIDMKLAKRMLVFAANWTIEQATGSDYKLYLLHFRWFSSKLQSCDHFFGSFLHLLEQELEHPIWKCIFHSYHELASLPDADPSLHLTPLLSLDFVDLSMSYDRPKVSYKFLCNAINCIELLRLSYLQWNAQSEHEYTNEAQHFKPVLGALQELEKEILNMLVESPSYDILIKLYSEMLEDHLTFWDVLTSSRFEQLPVSWHSLIKDILKLRDFSPVAVDNLFMIAGNIDKKLHQHSQQSLLWIHGGHPILPATAELFKQQQLFTELCESVWPTTVNPYNQGDDCLVKVAASSTPELRFLAVQGICMSAYITSRFDEDSSEVVLHLADMSQMLLKRFEYEKSKLEAKLNSIESGTIEGNSIFCCDFSPEARCTKPGFASWLETRPIIDNTSFFLDMDLLQKLSMIVLADRKECQLALRSVSNLLESAMKHSLTFSTRPPQNFIPHQKILWTLDAWMSVDAVNAKIASYVLEMWFWWHSSLWNHCPAFSENFGKVDGYHTPVPDMLVQPVRTASVVQSLRRTCAIKDYSVHCLKLKAASCNLWQSSLPGMDLSSFLLSVTRSLFQQIIYAHRKAFDADKFAAIESIFCSFHKNVATQDDIQCLVSILGSSNHQNLNSLVSLFIEPILKELYLHCSSTEVHLNMGHACLKMGALRFSLLLSCDDSDPAMKYSFKHSQLEERISSLELEIKVRQECDYLAGQLSSIEADKKRADALERLEIERRRIQKKMVFRCNPLKFNALRKECGEFLKPARKVVGLVDNIEGMDLQQVLEQASNWQATATSFIDRLSDEYKEYIDLAQPFQVAVYEMKLGLSLVLSFTLLKKVLNTIKEDNMDGVMESIYSFMRFPRVHAFISSSHSIGSPANFWDREMGILEKLIMLSSDVTTEKMGSTLQLRTGLYQNIVVRVAHFVADTQRIDDASFKILDKMFHEFANMWMNMKVQVKCKEGDDAQQYKFRPRALEIKSIVDVDFSTLDQFFPKDSFSEWQEFLSEEESLEKLEASNEHENVQDEWDLMQETIMKNMICIHNQLFGSTNLVLDAGTFHVDDADRLHSFTNSYTLGAGMIEGLGGLLTSSLDGKLIPEHLLRLCLEHGSKLVSSQKSSANYNFYKDSNAPMMAKMVKLVANLQLKICTLLSEWEDHPGLQKIMDTIQMLLAIPVETPLAKVLLGLQFLLNRARALQENESKFALSDQLEPISALVCSWQKMEFDSWPALLQEVQEQYDINAGKLWFPLFSVLHHSHSADITRYEESTIESIEEFIRTSSIGEFRARLQLLFALHGQITAGRCLEVQNYLSPQQEKNLQVLYNVFGYYIQFLPRILEDIEANRKGIEMELKEILKLFHWERTEICLSVENSKRTRQKLRKLILKYTDLLQQPVMLILDRETQQKGLKIHSLQFPRALKDNKNAISDLAQLCEKDRSIWLADWRKKVNDTLQNLHFKNTSGLSFLDNKDVTSITRQSLASHSSHLSCDEQWNVLCWTAEKIFKTAMDCDDLWNDTGKGVGKKRALSELLKLLETSGLHKHKFEIMKISNSSNWLFVQPSYNAQHLLLTPSRLSGEALDVSTYSESQCLPDDYVDTIWKSANEFYFKSVASVQLLQRICLKPHGDITYDQASRAVSFLNHLIVIQQSQRAAAYDFSKQSKCLRECTYAFGNSYLKCTDIDETTNSEYSIVQNQRALFQCMWKQKQLFDGLTTLLAEESLLLRTVESTHLKSCQSVRPAANHVLQFIEKFIPVTQKSKESLDNYLLGQLGGLQSLLQESLDKSLLGRDVTLSAGPSRPYIISKQMEQLVYKNFQVIKEFEEHFFDFRKQDWNRSFIIETLLGHFDDVFKEGKMLADQFESAVKQRSQTRDSSEEVGYNSGNNYQLEADFDSALKKAHNLVMEALEKQISPGDEGFLSEESLENISSWEYLFKSSVQGLNVEELCDTLLNIIIYAKKLVDHSGSETSRISFRIGRCFQHLHLLLELILGFCDGLLQDLLAMHKTVSIMTCELANVLASLFSKGFCISVKDEVDEASHDTSQTASGTGMGEGSGLNDVSDQITDEDQLLGTSEKPGDEQDASGEVPDKNEKGVEMEDLMADTFSVSDDSGEENEEDGEDEQLDSAMGEAGSDSEIVDEKLQNKDEDDNPNKTNERYESGPSVRDNDTSSRELRAKEDSAAITDDEPGEPDKQNNEIGNQDDLDDREENTDDMNMDKEEAFTDPTGLKLDESNQGSEEDMEMDEDMNEEGELDSKEEVSPEEGDESAEHGNNEEDNTIPTDETMEEPDSKPVDGTTVKDEPGRDREERSETNAMEPGKDEFELGISDLISDHVHGAESATQPNGPSQASDSKNATAEANMSNTSEAHNDLSLRSLPSGNTSQKDLMVSDSSNSGGFTNEQKQAQFPERESSDQRAQPNPYRNVGDALEEWKERVKVSVDLPGDTTEVSGEIEDKNADDYAFVSEFEKGTDQALGPATSEQIESNVNVNRSDEDNLSAQRDEVTKMEIEERDDKEWHLNYHASILRNKMEEQLQISDFKSEKEGSPEVQDHNGGDPQNMPESAISVRKSYLSEDMYQPDNLSVDDNELGKAQVPEEVPLDVKGIAAALWSRYELRTTRLSQELAEQLRLVLEPTIASKLQGDYKTGKRINMKKVIPYIASHYRKDKIWLRRTRPNKRDYQVVIAVDDSRSMSESCCGDVAVEALVTVCRAMSQLEMGNMAVASFGRKGNIRSLHDFDQPFTGEAGKKIISSLTFKQENTIADEPVVDLLKYLNNKLDAAVAKARLPSGQNPLQQLVLIIADGRFHEKEKLKRCVRDFLSRKRMVAFLVLDSPQESIMDQMEASFVGEGEKRELKFTKYLDSFPFPYYIVLKNIEALPRTLADLLRQWFELMQSSRE